MTESPRFGQDRERVVAAVKNHGYMLQYASEELRNDQAIVLAAVQQYGRCYYSRVQDSEMIQRPDPG